MKTTCANLILIVVVQLITTSFAFAQENPSFYKWSISASYGYSLPVTSLKKDEFTGSLINYSSNTFYVQPISVSYNFNRFGIEGSFSFCSNEKLYEKNDVFESQVSEIYSPDYFVTSLNKYSSNHFLIKGVVGPTYRIEKNNLVLIGRLLTGITHMSSNTNKSTLKEKGTNTLVNIEWKSTGNEHHIFTINPSLSIGYFMNRRVIWSLDINYWAYNFNVVYQEIKTDEITKNTDVKSYKSSDMVQEMSFGLGLTVVIF